MKKAKMPSKLILIAIIAVINVLLLSACADVEQPLNTNDTVQTDSSSTPHEKQVQTAVLYIGTNDSEFKEYTVEYTEELTPDFLISSIGALTGWDLTLAEPVISGKGGMSICLAASSSLFVGPPENQKEEFHMFDAEQLARTILDSIQKTLQMNFVGAGGNPDRLDIYYYMPDEKPLSLPQIEKEWPIDKPYSW